MDNDTQEWLRWTLVTSIPLRRLDAQGLPIGLACGCLIDYFGRRFLLSVQHAVTKSSKDWVVLLGYDDTKQMQYFRPSSFNFVGEMTRGASSIRDIDFCYTEVGTDIQPVYQYATPRAGIIDEKPCHVFASDLTRLPSPEEIYAFSGHVKPLMHGEEALVTEINVYPGLRYTHSESEYHNFRLPVPHPGHEQFRGCSGAPIVDRKRNVVALVCDGDESTNTIRGVSLARYKFAFDFLTGRLGGA